MLPEIPKSGLRELIFRGYRIIYRTSGKRVEILTVFEAHRRLDVGELG